LYNYFLRMGLDRDSAQDLTQNLFYRIIKYRSSYHEGSPVKAWIYQMARNLLTDFHLHEKKENDVLAKFSDEVKGSSEIFREEDFRRLDSAMKELPESQMELIVLSRYQQLKYSEISSVTGLSVPAIKVAIHRAIKQLRAIYIKQLKIDEK
ncbi:MAG TPA: RNA polymerase sigma factor, partial [Bacteroidales bacterium]|nr:RNA polymerase sigma factor [Bacteroidales bacterium]